MSTLTFRTGTIQLRSSGSPTSASQLLAPPCAMMARRSTSSQPCPSRWRLASRHDGTGALVRGQTHKRTPRCARACAERRGRCRRARDRQRRSGCRACGERSRARCWRKKLWKLLRPNEAQPPPFGKSALASAPRCACSAAPVSIRRPRSRVPRLGERDSVAPNKKFLSTHTHKFESLSPGR